MNLEIIRTQTTWNDAAGSINNNYAKIADAIAQLKANGGGGGGGADIDLTDYATKVWVEAKGYITASALTPYLKTEDAEETYATKDFVDNKLVDYAPLTSVQGFENRIGGLEGAVPKLNERVEQLAATKLDSSYFTLANIKSTLGISDWALSATKPSYAWSEINSRPTALSQFTDDVVAGKYLRATIYGNFDADTLFNDGFRSGYMSHLPSGSPYGVVHTLSYRGGSNNAKPDYAAQIFIPCGDDSTSPNDMFFRTALADTWNTWTKVITDKNIGNYEAGSSVRSKGLDRITSIPESIHCVYFYSGQPTLGDDINNAKEGSNAYHLWSYPVNGTYVSGGTANIMNLRLQFNIAYLHDIFVSPNFDDVWHRSIINYKCNPWRKFAFTDSNVASATKLQTPRKLWGQSFDGTDNVSGDINNAAGGIYIHNTNEINSFQDKLYLNHRGSGQTGYGSTNDIVMVANGGNVGIGTTAITEKLDVAGNIKASGNINATSITINGVTITASNGSITVNGNVFATGDITGGV